MAVCGCGPVTLHVFINLLVWILSCFPESGGRGDDTSAPGYILHLLWARLTGKANGVSSSRPQRWHSTVSEHLRQCLSASLRSTWQGGVIAMSLACDLLQCSRMSTEHHLETPFGSFRTWKSKRTIFWTPLSPTLDSHTWRILPKLSPHITS